MARSGDVDAWFGELDHPQKALMLKARDAILAADRRIDECIKWSCPTFTYEGNLVSISPQAKSHVSLLFHTGAKIPGKHVALEGGGDTARYMKFADAMDLTAKKTALTTVVRAWCDWKGGGAKPKSKR